MQLTQGQWLGPYQIVDHIGAGGMGSVYRARDTRLDRSVAIKVLSEDLIADERFRERLTREARAISSLSHPNICALYDIGQQDGFDYLVMEFLDGETLADRLSAGPLPLRQALRHGAEIASALEAAHRAGVMHRDLKPANVILTRSGARLLDFGLAKSLDRDSTSRALTAAAPLTEPGMVVGTLNYMSPEQVAGQALDARSDLFSFGAVLYEMLGGRRAFDGTSRTAVINAILNETPAPLSEAIPESVARVVQKCLEKSPDERWQSAHDVADELRWLAGRSSGTVRPAPPAWRSAWIWAAALLPVLAVGVAIPFMRSKRVAFETATVRFAIEPPNGTGFTQRAISTEIAVSPDGKQIAFVAVQGGRRSLYLRSLDGLTAHEIDGTGGAVSPFWSPDSKWIGFFAQGLMKKFPANGGAVQTICAAHGGSASWGKDGTIIFASWGPVASEAILAVSENGGAIRPITDHDGWHFWPSFLSDGRHFLYRLNRGLRPEAGLYLASLDDSKKTLLLTNTSRAEATRDNMLYFVRDGVLMKQQLDLSHRTMVGEATPIAQPAFCFFPTANANFTIDASGDVVAYQRSPAQTQLVWRDGNGHETGRLRATLNCRNFRLSPDGRRVAIEQFEPSTEVSNLWIYDLERDVMTRLTTNRFGTYAPIWSSDREMIVSDVPASGETEPPQLAQLALASRTFRPLMKNDGVENATDTAPDGTGVLYTIDRGDQKDIELLSTSGNGKPVPIASSEFNESWGVLSRYGRWMAFQSDESGRPEIYVRPFRREGETTRVSTDGGIEPRWSRGGKNLYYIAPSGMLTQVSANLGDTIRLGRAVALFRISSAGMMEQEELGLTHYDVGLDDQHFLVREITGGSDDAPVVVIVSVRR